MPPHHHFYFRLRLHVPAHCQELQHISGKRKIPAWYLCLTTTLYQWHRTATLCQTCMWCPWYSCSQRSRRWPCLMMICDVHLKMMMMMVMMITMTMTNIHHWRLRTHLGFAKKVQSSEETASHHHRYLANRLFHVEYVKSTKAAEARLLHRCYLNLFPVHPFSQSSPSPTASAWMSDQMQTALSCVLHQ